MRSFHHRRFDRPAFIFEILCHGVTARNHLTWLTIVALGVHIRVNLADSNFLNCGKVRFIFSLDDLEFCKVFICWAKRFVLPLPFFVHEPACPDAIRYSSEQPLFFFWMHSLAIDTNEVVRTL